MIALGELTLGEPCAPHTITKYAIVEGKIHKSEIEVYGRKVSLLYIRKKLLTKHKKFMRLHTDAQINSMSRCELVAILSKASAAIDNETNDSQLRNNVRRLERTRTLAFWHDPSTLLGRGYILITVKILYDTVVFKHQFEI